MNDLPSAGSARSIYVATGTIVIPDIIGHNSAISVISRPLRQIIQNLSVAPHATWLPCPVPSQPWSPQQIAAKLHKTHPSDPPRQVSHETIHAAIYAHLRGGLKKALIEEDDGSIRVEQRQFGAFQRDRQALAQ